MKCCFFWGAAWELSSWCRWWFNTRGCGALWSIEDDATKQKWLTVENTTKNKIDEIQGKAIGAMQKQGMSDDDR